MIINEQVGDLAVWYEPDGAVAFFLFYKDNSVEWDLIECLMFFDNQYSINKLKKAKYDWHNYSAADEE